MVRAVDERIENSTPNEGYDKSDSYFDLNGGAGVDTVGTFAAAEMLVAQSFSAQG